MVPQNHLLASISGAYNAIHFQGDTVGNVLLYGQGAGMIPTGSAVAADVVDIARNIACGSIGRVPALSYLPEQMQPRRITPMDELYGPYYFRLTVLDQPGVLSAIAGILCKYEIDQGDVLLVRPGQRALGMEAKKHFRGITTAAGKVSDGRRATGVNGEQASNIVDATFQDYPEVVLVIVLRKLFFRNHAI